MNLASQSGEAGAGQLLLANFNQDNTEKEHKNSWSQTTPFGLVTVIVLGDTILFVLIYKLKMVFEAPSALKLEAILPAVQRIWLRRTLHNSNGQWQGN